MDAQTNSDKKIFGARFVFPALPVILHAAAAIYFAAVLNVWRDEASTLYTSGQGFAHAFFNAGADEKQAPLYFIVLSVWRALDGSIFFARLFSVVCTAAAIKFFYDAARRFTSHTAAKFLCLLFAVNPFLIWAATEIRVYAAVVLLSVLLLKFFEAGYLNFENQDAARMKRSRIFYVLTATIALYTNYYTGFILVGGFLALLALKRYAAARAYFLQMLVVGALFTPLVFSLRQQFLTNANAGYAEEKSTGEGLRILTTQISNFIFPIEFSAVAAPSILTLLRIWFLRLAALLLIFLLAKNKFRALDEKISSLAVITATVCAFLLSTYFMLGAEFAVSRHFTVLFAPLLLFAAAFAARIFTRKKQMFVFAALFALLFPYTRIYKQFPGNAKAGDWARVARFIEQNEKPNQPVIVFPAFDALALPYHYAGANEILPDEKFFDWQFDYADRAGEREVAFIAAKIPPVAQEIWLATEIETPSPKDAEGIEALENFVRGNYTVLRSEDFYKERIRLLRRK